MNCGLLITRFVTSLLQLFKEIISEMKLEPDDVFLAQGTLRPDLIESASLLASTNAHVIKTHHNDTQLVRQLREQVCEISLGMTLNVHNKVISCHKTLWSNAINV